MLLLLSFFGFHLYNLHPHLQPNPNYTRFGVIMDAGSSGTRVYLYSWIQNEALDPVVYPMTVTDKNQTKQLTIKTKGGLQTKNISEIESYLTPLINYAKNYIPKEQISTSPIYLKATAGMRLLEEEKRIQIIDKVEDVFKNSGFKTNENSVKVISGEEEGVFGWISVNYMLNETIDSSYTYATLDMGGASTQITFEPKAHPTLDLFDLTLNQTTRTLYTKSYLGYGENQALDRYYDMILVNSNRSVVYDPCYLTGYNKTVLPKSSTPLVGSGNFSQCMKKVEELIKSEDTASCPYVEGCGINGEYQPKIPADMEIVAINGFYYVVNFFGIENEASLSEVLEKANKYCSEEKYPKDSFGNPLEKDSFFDSQCFNTAYMLNLVKHGFKVDYNRTIDFTLKVDDVEATWTSGALMYELSQSATNA